MKRPTVAQLNESLTHSIKVLEQVQKHSPELLRRREHEAGRDGYPSQSMGDGGSSGVKSSSTETAALGKAIVDPTGHAIDSIIKFARDLDQQVQIVQGQLHEVIKTETEMRGRVSTVSECRSCPNPLLGHANGDRRGFCAACYKAYQRWSMTASDSSAFPIFVATRKRELKETA